MPYLKHALILVVFTAVFVILVAAICSLVVYVPIDIGWRMVIAITLISLGACPLLATHFLWKVVRPPLLVFDVTACTVISLLAIALLNYALSFFIYKQSGKYVSGYAWHMLWINWLGWLVGMVKLWNGFASIRRQAAKSAISITRRMWRRKRKCAWRSIIRSASADTTPRSSRQNLPDRCHANSCSGSRVGCTV